ncbi:MAG: hypothetical protein ACOVP8_07990, partial [Phycisphaerales bacterium]
MMMSFLMRTSGPPARIHIRAMAFVASCRKILAATFVDDPATCMIGGATGRTSGTMVPSPIFSDRAHGASTACSAALARPGEAALLLSGAALPFSGATEPSGRSRKRSGRSRKPFVGQNQACKAAPARFEASSKAFEAPSMPNEAPSMPFEAPS